MTRDQLQHEITALDRQINQEIAANKLSNTNLKHRSFPTGSWVGAVGLFALGVLSGSIPALKPMAPFGWLLMLAGAFFALFALWSTIMFLIKGRVKYDKSYGKAMEKVALLQAQRQELQKKMKELK